MAGVFAASVTGSSRPQAMTSVRPSRVLPPQRLALRVPERDLEPGLGRLVGHGVQLAFPATRDGLELERGVPGHDRTETLADHILHGPERVAGELIRRAGFAETGETLVGLDPDQVAGAHGERR